MTTHTPRSRAADPQAPSPAERGRQLAQRISRLVRGHDPQEPPGAETETSEWPAVAAPEEDEIMPRFPYVRHGYDSAAVDEYVAGLERELAELDSTLAELRDRLENDVVSSEIKRLGEETSSVLIAAHETREKMLREAQAEVDHRLAEAARQASAIISEQETRARELQEQNETLRRERERLVESVRSISTALTEVAESAREPE